MHEYAIVEQLIEEFLKTPLGRSLPRARAVRLRYGPGLTEASVRQAFAVQAKGTPLALAAVEVGRIPVEVVCPCGARSSPFPHEHDDGTVHDHDHGTPYALCERCGSVNPIPSFNALELTHAE